MFTIIPGTLKLYRSLFHTREDVFAAYWEDRNSQKSGYAPVYRLNQDSQALTDTVLLSHLQGQQTIGVYPLFSDNTTSFLVLDFDGNEWLNLINKVVSVAQTNGLSPSIEKSRSGNGGHLWFFFAEKIPAVQVRQLGKILLSQAGIRNRKVFDRMFPSQDEHVGKGLGNLICLPLQGKLVKEHKTVFVTPQGQEIPNQWEYLGTIKKITKSTLGCYLSLSNLQDKKIITGAVVEMEPFVCTTQGQEVKLTLGAQIFIPTAWLPDRVYRFLKKELNFSNPEFYTKERFGYSTWNTARWIKTIEVVPSGINLPIGFLHVLLDFITKNSFSRSITDLRVINKEIQFSSTLQLRPDQQKTLDQLLIHERAILEAHPGFGKTMVALALMENRHQKTLIIVHTKTLLHQWHERIIQNFNISKKDLGMIGENKWKVGEKVTIASYMTLTRRGIEEIKNEFGFIIIDECHHVPANTFSSVVRQFAAKYVLGLTATAFRKDKLEKLMHLYVSDNFVLASETEKIDDQQTPCTVTTKLLVKQTAFKTQRPIDFHALSKLIISDSKRNAQIAQDIIEVMELGEKCLVLTERVEHGAILLNLIRQKTKGIHAAVATGVMTKKQRQRITQRLEQERFQLLIATGKLIGEGFDWPAVSHLFLAFPFSWKGKLIQYVGRVQRSEPGKTVAVVHDYFDEQVTMLKLMYFKRLRTYRSLGLINSGPSIKNKESHANQLNLF